MQLKRLYIKEFKILKDFTYEFPFDSKRYNNILIGINGSGKSTILEAIAEIFSCVILNEKSKFGFEFEYRIKQDFLDLPKDHKGLIPPPLVVKLFAKQGVVPKILLNFRGSDEFVEPPILIANGIDFIPRSIVIYYSGVSVIMEELCNKHEEIQKDEFLKGKYFIQNRIVYYRPENFNVLLLSLLSYEFGDIKEYIFDKLGITELSSFSIHMKRPNASWAKGKKAKDIWGAKGAVKDFSIVLHKFAKFTMHSDDDNSIEFIFPFIERLYSIKNKYGSERKIFELLQMTYYEGMLDRINISFNKGIPKSSSIPQDGEIHFNSKHLSEGEQQAITIRGLSELFAQENSLFLFDEPDTYLHPKWQHQFINEIEESIEQNAKNEITYLIATHSPQILSNAKPDKTSVKIIEDGQLVEITPKHYGREISSILYNLMEVEERNETIRNDLSELFTLIEDEEIEEAETELQRLTEILGETDPDIINAEIQLKYLKVDEAD